MLARLFIMLFVAALAGGAHAQGLEPETRAARAHFLAGQAYFRQGELRRALDEFKAAQRDDARPELDYNIGLAYDRLGDAARAVDAYRRFLAARPDTGERAVLEARIATLERAIGELVVASHVLGATITVDGEVLDVLRIGQPVRLTEGLHRLTAAKEPLLTQRRDARVEAGKRVVVELDPQAVAHPVERGMERRTQLAIGLGVAGAVVLIGAVALGVYFGTRAPDAFDPGGPAGVIAVRPLALRQP